MKMTAGELVGYYNCLGYAVNPKTKGLTIISEEAKIVRYIFRRYNESAGTTILARELQEHGWGTKYGKKKWSDTTILGIIKNEKYKGDLLQGKTFTVDPISKKRSENHGESDQYYVANHHPAIVSKEEWEKANERRKRLSYARKTTLDGTRVRFSREYTFSSTLECRFCGRGLSRRAWNNSNHYSKVVWQCLNYAKG